MREMSASQYYTAFNSVLKTTEREDFNLLLCDLDTCKEQQKALLKPLLLEENGHQVAEYWGKYIAYVIKSLSERNVHLQRLVNKALDFLPAAENRDNKFYLGIHLQSAGLKTDRENALKYIENIIVKKRIGLKCSVLYLEWAKTILLPDGGLDVETIRKARDALKRGIKANATPQELVEKGLKFLDGYNDASKHEEMAQHLRAITAIREDGTMVASNTEARELLRQHPALNRGVETVFRGTTATPATATKTAARRGEAYEGGDDETHDIQRNLGTSSTKRGPATVEKTLGGPTGRINRLGGLGGLGKVGRCQRVVKKEDEDDDVDSSRDVSFEQGGAERDTTSNNGPTEETIPIAKSTTATSTVDMSIMNSSKESGISSRSSLSETSTGSKRKSTSSSEEEESTGTNKLDLSKYIDDKLLSFDPLVARSTMKRSKVSRNDALNSSTLSTTGTVAVGSAIKVPQSTSKRTSLESKRSIDATSDKENIVPKFVPEQTREDAPARALKSQQEVRFANAAASSPSSSSSRTKRGAVTTTTSDNPLANFSETFKVIHMNGQQYLRFGTLGKGGSSCVYSILSQDSQVYAFKKVFVSANTADPESLFDSYVNEIELLNSLKGSPYIIQLIDSQVDKQSLSVSMIMEAGEIDLSKVLKKRNQIHGISPFFTRMIWTEMLESVDHIHENRIVHGDLKPANFVFVKGHLKLIDFGIAKAFNNDTTNIYRDSQIGTINYMAPEAIVAPKQEEMSNSSKGAKLRLGRASDVWSLGCILYQLIYGSPPFAALNTIQKLHAIPNPSYEISYPTKIRVGPVPKEGEEGNPEDIWYIHAHTIDSMKACLFRDPAQRSPIRGQGGLLSKPFLVIGDTGKQIL